MISNGQPLNSGEPLIVSAAVFILILILPALLSQISHFQEARRYIKMEIHRSVDTQERSYWRRELKILYLTQLPIVRYFINR